MQFEHIRKHLQEEREKEQKEKGIRDSVKLVWVLHADRDREKEESEDEDDEEVCVCITQAPASTSCQPASKPAAPLAPLLSISLPVPQRAERSSQGWKEGEELAGQPKAAEQLHDLRE